MFNWEFTPYAIPLFAGALIMGLVALMTWRRRTVRGARALMLLALTSAFYALGYALELGSPTLDGVRFWLKLEYVGVTLAPVVILVMVLVYVDQQHWLTPFSYSLLLLIPSLTLVFAWTNEQHELIWQNITLDRSGDFTATAFTPGGWYWVHIAYFYLVVIISAALLVREFTRAQGFYRRQIGLMALGLLGIPALVLGIYLARLAPKGLDLNPYALTAASFVVAWNMFSFRFMDIMPVAREAVLVSMSDAVFVVDAQERVVYLNPVAQQFLSPRPVTATTPAVTPSGPIGQPAARILAFWDRLAAKTSLAGQFSTEITLDVQGEARHYDLRLSALLSPTGNRQGCLVVLRDITVRIQAEYALRETNRLLTTLHHVDSELSRKLEVHYVARLALEVAVQLGQAHTGFIGVIEDEKLRIIEGVGVYRPDTVTPPLSTGIVARTLHTGRAELVSDVSQDPNYVTIDPKTQAQMTMPLISNEKLIGLLSLETHDAASFSAEVFETIHLLASRVAVAIDNARMYEEGERLVRELEAFAHTVAHDLKNPLTSIIGFAEYTRLAIDQLSHDALIEHLRLIEANGEKANNIIHSLLLLAGLRASGPVKIGPIDMAHIIDDVCQQIKPQIAQFEAQVTAPDSWPAAQGYAPWVEEIWVNYLTNALKYGGRPPHIELGYDEPVAGSIRFWVRDNGAGLAAEQQAEVFRPFTRLDQTKARGHGLGLSIVQRIIEKLGGKVGVESTPGQGSLFYFVLPAATLPETSENNATEEPPPAQETGLTVKPDTTAEEATT
ncbi:MAG: GAF domain-containing protein [Chloroflexi bacterium]|nr:GAF domain-containing protein [Chloroflexota bacterium]